MKPHLSSHPDSQEALRIGPPPPQIQASRGVGEGLAGGGGSVKGKAELCTSSRYLWDPDMNTPFPVWASISPHIKGQNCGSELGFPSRSGSDLLGMELHREDSQDVMSWVCSLCRVTVTLHRERQGDSGWSFRPFSSTQGHSTEK